MFLLEYIIKLLMGNSDTMFMGFVVVVFGYYGWLLWHLRDDFDKFTVSWDRHEKHLEEIKQKMTSIDDGVYKDLMKRLEENKTILERMQLTLSDTNGDLGRYRQDVINAIKDSTEDIKEIMMILMNNRARSVGKKKDKEQGNDNRNQAGSSAGNNKKKNYNRKW